MHVKLLSHEHGKARVRLLKVRRDPEKHYVTQLEAEILLQGPADAAYYDGDNSNVLPTDSVKNTVYVLAKKHEFRSLEDFAIILAKHFIETHPEKVNSSSVKLVGVEWDRMVTPASKGGLRPHHHAFIGNGTAVASTFVIAKKPEDLSKPTIVTVSSGIDKVRVLKTTKSGFVNFFRDAYTTLPDVPDRLVSTVIQANWKYKADQTITDYKAKADEVKRVLLETFAGPSDVGVDSPAVQYTLYQMGEAVLKFCTEVEEITITMPNVHNLPVDVEKFGLKNLHPHGEIFLPTDEPHGVIRATMGRVPRKSRL